MVDCLLKLGFDVRVEPDADEICNRTITVHGRGGEIPNAGTREKPLDLFVGNAGTAARFLSAMVCLGRGAYRMSGVPRMHERPQAALFQALRELGYTIDVPTGSRAESQPGHLPVVIHGTGPREGRCSVSIRESSQFASALLLCAEVGRWHIEVVGENAEESSYVAMTRALILSFGTRQRRFRIEPDASSGSYFWAAGRLASSNPFSSITVANWPDSGWQADEKFPRFLNSPRVVSRRTDLGDSIMTAIVIAAAGPHTVTFTDLGRLRVQECERVAALRTELSKCGVDVLERGDTLTVSPSTSTIHGADIETYDDHRMAMCFAVLGLNAPGIKLHNPACVKKTFPDFFQKLAAEPPHGLGATVLDGRTGRKLSHDELFAV
jgi:3-phosphoshikimate 1-carboxyvinyltransferase